MKKNNIIIYIIVIIGLIALAIFLAFIIRKPTFNVTFTSDGEIIEVKKVKKNSTVSKPIDPKKEGYKFDNWYLDDEVYDFSSNITKDITLVAKWALQAEVETEEEFVVSFDTNGGNSITSIKIKNNGIVEKPDNPVKEGYVFVEWRLDGKPYDFSQKVIKNITLVAVWKKQSASSESKTVDVESVTLSDTELSLKVGKNKTLTATINPTNATNKSIKWSSSNTSVATVDSNGKVTAIGAGSAVITAKVDGKTAKCTVTVEEEITYSVVWQKVEESNIGQYLLYIKSSKGNYVSGKVEITTVNDKVSIVDVPTTGIMYVKSAIKSATISSIN